MLAASKMRGATAIEATAPRLPSQHLIAAGVLACAVVTAMILPSGEPEQATQGTLSESQQAAAPATVASEPAPALAAELPAPTQLLPPEPPPPQWHEHEVKRGDTLSSLFKRAGYSDRDIYRVVHEAPDGKNLSRIYPGQTIAFQADETGGLAAVRHVKSPLETVEYRHGDTGFTSELIVQQPEVRETWAAGEITSSLFLAGQQAGLSQNLIMEMAGIFGGVIDFVLDPRVGDTLHVVYQELYLDGAKYRDGEILAAAYTNQGKTFNAFRYQDSHGDVGYYNEAGESMRKAFLMAPVDFTRISSNFNPRRRHPIYKTTRPHRGTDYAAPRGTPVFASGDGKVIRAGYSKANGNYVFIQHGQDITTHYLHLHKRAVKAGQRVSQSQVIGTVGSTGAATGPHLHYEFLVNGVHRNPRTIHKQLPKAESLPAAEMPGFRAAIQQASTQLAALRSDTQLAMNGAAGAVNAAP